MRTLKACTTCVREVIQVTLSFAARLLGLASDVTSLSDPLADRSQRSGMMEPDVIALVILLAS